MKTSTNIFELQLLAASQWGLFSSAQAQDVGVGRTQLSRMLADGRIENLTFGIYRFTSGETTSFADVKAAWMSIFPRETAFDRFKKETPDAIVAGTIDFSKIDVASLVPDIESRITAATSIPTVNVSCDISDLPISNTLSSLYSTALTQAGAAKDVPRASKQSSGRGEGQEVKEDSYGI